MLEPLFGSQSVQKVLIFLFVNGKGYGTQLHRLLNTSLTPIQKALLKLEKGGIILSYFEGKTRVYQFNPAFPLLNELEALLKKAYTLLPAHEKREYFVAKDEISSSRASTHNKYAVLNEFWERLGKVRHLTFYARSKSKEESGWNGNGRGEVIVTREKENVMVFSEKGNWLGKQGEMNFSNVFRWIIDRKAGVISLEHLRRGVDHPVFLFLLAPSSRFILSSVDSHLCEGDTYFGQLHLDSSSLRLNWRVIGPKKNEEIDYYYS